MNNHFQNHKILQITGTLNLIQNSELAEATWIWVAITTYILIRLATSAVKKELINPIQKYYIPTNPPTSTGTSKYQILQGVLT